MRTLDPVEARILGALLEKQQATPEYYPLTINALMLACNQKTSREPVTDYSEAEIERALSHLQDEKLVWRVLGGRAVRWDHNFDSLLGIDRPAKAALTLLLLRGPQTAGEIRGRTDRLHEFAAVSDVDAVLAELASRDEPLVAQLERQPGQKETRWTHLLSGAPEPAPASASAPVVRTGSGLSERVTSLEEAIAGLREEIEGIKRALGM